MDIYVLDGPSSVVGIVQAYQSIIWNMQYYGTGDFQMIVPGTDENITMLQPGRYLVKADDFGSGVYKNVMVVRDRKYNFDVEAGWLMEVTGPGLKKIVGQRVIWDQTNLSGNVEAGIRQVITENIISPADTARAMPGFSLAPVVGITDEWETQLRGENIAEWLETVGTTYGIGWDVYISAGGYVFELYKGTDRTYNSAEPVIFSPEFDNLASAEYTQKTDGVINAALIGGEGEGLDQVMAQVGTAEGFERVEGYIDGGSVSSNEGIITEARYIELLKEYGTEQIADAQLTADTFTGEIIQSGVYRLNRDYFLGDRVQVAINQFRAAVRIIEIIYAEDESGSSLLPTFAEWEVG